MSLTLNGKQIKQNTLSLDRLSLNGYTVGDTLFGVSPNKALVNKEYVDQSLLGLTPKQSVLLATTPDDGNINLTVGGLLTIDGVLTGVGNRVLVKDQTNLAQNGVYIVGVGAWVRSPDFDGNPTALGEIQRGDYIFVSGGLSNIAIGFIVISNGSFLGNFGLEHEIGVNPIEFTSISAAISYIPGDGLLIDNGNINLSLTPNGGLEISSQQLRVNIVDALNLSPTSLFGDGIDYTSSILSVDLRPNSGLSFTLGKLGIANGSITDAFLNLGSDINEIDATTIPLDTFGTYLGTAGNIQEALEELELSIAGNILTGGSGIEVNGSSIDLGGVTVNGVVLTGGVTQSFQLLDYDSVILADSLGANVIILGDGFLTGVAGISSVTLSNKSLFTVGINTALNEGVMISSQSGGINLVGGTTSMKLGDHQINGTNAIDIRNTSSLGIELGVGTLNSGLTSNFFMTNNRFVVSFDSPDSGGIVYANDYSATATFRTIMDKAYIDATVNTIATTKQDTLVSGTNIKTINTESILGTGNITIVSSSPVNSSTLVAGISREATRVEILTRVAATSARLYVNPSTLLLGDFSDFTEAIRLPQITAIQRSTLTGLVKGSTIYNTTTNTEQIWNGTIWVEKLSNTLPENNMFVGNASNIATAIQSNNSIVREAQLVAGVFNLADVNITLNSYVFVTSTKVGIQTGLIRTLITNGNLLVYSANSLDQVMISDTVRFNLMIIY